MSPFAFVSSDSLGVSHWSSVRRRVELAAPLEVASAGPSLLQAGAALPRRLTYRRTVDGRLCAAEFTYQSATYADCTTDVSPGGVAGKESAA